MSEQVSRFRIETDQTVLDDLRDRLRRTRWPERETVPGWTQGVPLGYVQELCRYWAQGYDWRATEARLNRFPQFRTEIDGLGIHFVHVRSRHPEALALIMTHGWPGSIVEFLKVIGPLTDPVAHGGSASTSSRRWLRQIPPPSTISPTPSDEPWKISNKPVTPGTDIPWSSRLGRKPLATVSSTRRRHCVPG